MVGLGTCNWCKKAALNVNLVEQSHVQQLFDPTYVTNYLVVCNRCEVEILMVYEIYCNISIKNDKSYKKCLVCNKKSIYLFNVNENKAENGESFLQKLQYCSGITSKKTLFLACPKCIHIMDLWYQLKFQYEINAKFVSPTRQPKVTLIRDYGQGTPSRRLFNATDAPSQKLEKLQKSLLLTIRQFNNSRRRGRGSFKLNLKPLSQSEFKVKPAVKKNNQIYSQICYVNLTDSILEDMSYWHERLPVVRLENMDLVNEKGRKRVTYREQTPNKKVKLNSGSGKRKGTPFKLTIKPLVEKRAPIKLTIKSAKKQSSSKQARKSAPKKTPTKIRSRKATPKKIVREKNVEKLPCPERERSVSIASDRTEFEFDFTPFARSSSQDDSSSMINNTSRTPSPEFFRAQPMMLVRSLKAPEPEITSETITCDLPPRVNEMSILSDSNNSNFIVPDVVRPQIQNSADKSVRNNPEDIITIIHDSASISSTAESNEETNSDNTKIVNSMEKVTTQPIPNLGIDNSTVEQDPEVQSTVPDTLVNSNLKAIENGIKDYVFNLSPSDSEPLSDKLSTMSEQTSTKNDTFNKVAQQLEDLDA